MSNNSGKTNKDEIVADLYARGVYSLNRKVTRSEEILKSNRGAVVLLTQAHDMGHADASHWLGVVKIHDLDGTGQDLTKAADFFATAYERGSKKSLEAVMLVHRMMSDRLNRCLTEGFTSQARDLGQKINELTAWALKAQSEQVPLRRTKTNRNETIEFPLPERILFL